MAQDVTLIEILKIDDPYRIISNLTSAIEKFEGELDNVLSVPADEQADYINRKREELAEYRMALKPYVDKPRTSERLPTGKE